MRVIFTIVLVLAAQLVDASTNGVAPGPFTVSTLKLEWNDAARKREVPAKIYFPKEATSACPVIVFSHGLGGTRDGYEYLGRHWASHGYVSVHLQHHGSDDSVWRGKANPQAALREATKSAEIAKNRPLDVSFALDQLTKENAAPGPLRGKLDLEHVGMAGHSFGAWTTLVIAGQRLGLGLASLADRRVKAAIPMSAPVPMRRDESTYAEIEIPLLHMTGTADDSPIGDTSAKERRIPFDSIANASQILITFSGGDHMVFSGRTSFRSQRDAARAHALICASTTAFWDANLRGDVEAAAWIRNGELKTLLGTNAVLEVKDK